MRNDYQNSSSHSDSVITLCKARVPALTIAMLLSASTHVQAQLLPVSGLPSLAIQNGLTPIPLPQPVVYNVRDLGAISRNAPVGCGAYGTLNNSSTGYVDHPYLLANTPYLLYSYSGFPGWVYQCNGHSEVVGTTYARAVVWDVDWTHLQYLPDYGSAGVLSGKNNSQANDINGSRAVVGYVTASIGGVVFPFAALWNTSTVPNQDSPAPVQLAFNAVAQAINERGEIVGECGVDTTWSTGTPCYFRNDANHSVTNIGNSAGAAFDINSNGLVVGTFDQNGNRRGFYWTYSSTPTTLNPVRVNGSVMAHAEARAVNDVGTIVGTSYNGTPEDRTNLRATIWTGGMTYDLNTGIGNQPITLNEAVGVSSNGTILCGGVDSYGIRHAYCLTQTGTPWSKYFP